MATRSKRPEKQPAYGAEQQIQVPLAPLIQNSNQEAFEFPGPGTNEFKLPTVAEILELPEVRRGRPTIEAARYAIDGLVRWVHVSEMVDIGHLLQGGELILTTALAFPNDDEKLSQYVKELAAAQASGLIIELGQHFTEIPRVLIRNAEAHGLPLIALHTEVPFVAITEAIHSIIVNTQFKQLQLGEVVHKAFRSLAADASTPFEIVQQVAHLANCPAVFESLSRHVITFAGASTSGTEVLDGWEPRSRQVAWGDGSGIADGENWTSTLVSARGQMWGRLIIMPDFPADPLQRMILELGATTLALHLLIERDERVLDHQAHRTLIGDIIHHRFNTAEEILVRIESLGVATKRRLFIAMIVRSETASNFSDVARQSRAIEEATAVANAISDLSIDALVGTLEPGRIGILIALPPNVKNDTVLNLVARAIHESSRKLLPLVPIFIGVGPPVNSIDRLQAAYAEAAEAADAARTLPGEHLFVTTADIRLRGLVHLLREDARLQSFVKRELGSLIDYDIRHHTDLVATLAAFLEAGGNKSKGAATMHTTRATFYHHLSRVEDILNVDLESPESQYSLYVALIARQSFES